MFEALTTWFFSLGPRYGVDPVIFGSIYVGAVPFFTASVAWLIRNMRRGKPIAMPLVVASFFFISAYLYLIAVGRNIPVWVYGVIVAMCLFGIYSTFRKVSKQTRVRHL